MPDSTLRQAEVNFALLRLRRVTPSAKVPIPLPIYEDIQLLLDEVERLRSASPPIE